jgi:hypothetical protein
MKITRTITIDGKTKEEYEQIKTHLESLTQSFPGWNLHYEPLVNRITAIKVEEVDSL